MTHEEQIQLAFRHRVVFTRDALDPANPSLADCFAAGGAGPARVLAFLDTRVAHAVPDLPDRLRRYVAARSDRLALVDRVQPVVGGELCKNDRDAMYRVLEAIHRNRIDRQSYVLAIGGGAVLDCVGFAAAIAHRGVRLVRMPTTTLAQADSGVGVKCGINGFGQKNFLGAFAVPWAVVNDEAFLATLPDDAWRGGFAEAVKVALLKDPELFGVVEAGAAQLRRRDPTLAGRVIRRSAELHLRHIARGGDPFEVSSARPLDFGHWAAHKLEAMSGFTLGHGDAVAIGLALDCTCAAIGGLLPRRDLGRILRTLRGLGFELWSDGLRDADALLAGLDEFREHLGGELTITLLRGIGDPVDVHRVEPAVVRAAIAELEPLAAAAPGG